MGEPSSNVRSVRPRAWLRTRVAWLVLMLAVTGCSHPGEPLPKLGAVPEFSLRDQQARTITLATLRGKVWIADFMFTSCPDVCPLLTETLAGVRKRLPKDSRLAFVSFSVDPEHDTPERLTAFAKSHGALVADWSFLTGPIDDVKRVVVQGFKQAMEAQPLEPEKPRNVLHGTHFVLVDASGTIRGYYRSESDAVAELEAATRQLLQETKGTR